VTPVSARTTEPAPTSETFTDAITLRPVEPERFDIAFAALTQPCPWPKAYGGDMAAQAVTAAMRSVTDGKTLHSTHSYFLRPVDIGAEVRYEVEILRDGRGFSTRQVRGYQHGKVVYIALASFAEGGDGDQFAHDAPANLPNPDELPSAATYLADRTGGTMTEDSREYWGSGRSFDMRHVPGPIYLSIEGNSSPHQAVWIKPFDALRTVTALTDAQRDLAALIYLCDFTILEPVLRVLDLPWAQPGLVTASLDHAMWFHRRPPAGLDGWLLYAQDAGSAAAGRGLGVGRIFTRDNSHLATVVQEGMIRPT
jgi:acyl-CoA thioesterase-2